MKQESDAEKTPPTFIGRGCTIKGSIIQVVSLHIEGLIEGDILDGSSLVIGKTGVVNGNIRADKIVNFGTINGDVTASESFSIRKSGKHKGQINARVLSVEKGAVCCGKVFMDDTSSSDG